MNPYAPPEATLRDPPSKTGSLLKAIALGLAVDIGGTVLAGAILAFVYAMGLAASGSGSEEIAATMSTIATDSWLFYAGTLIGLGFSVLGGYVCARVAQRSELKLGAILAAASAVLGILISAEHYQLGTLLSLTLAGIGAVLFGARLGYARNRRIK